MLRVLDLFSGIGGFSLGLERTGGFRTVAFCEIDPFCRAVLRKRWPGVPCFEDIRTVEAYRTSEAPGGGYIRRGEIVGGCRSQIRGKSSVNVGCSASADDIAGPDRSPSSQVSQRNTHQEIEGAAPLSVTRGSYYPSADTGGKGTRSSLSVLRESGNGHRPHHPGITRGPNGTEQSAIAVSPMSSPKVQNGQEGGLNGIHADIGPIDVICGGFP